jgi:hypothetical protein
VENIGKKSMGILGRGGSSESERERKEGREEKRVEKMK